jgi:hypothetical protein
MLAGISGMEAALNVFADVKGRLRVKTIAKDNIQFRLDNTNLLEKSFFNVFRNS